MKELPSRNSVAGVIAMLAALGLFLVSCKREERKFQVDPSAAQAFQGLRLSELIPGAHNTNAPVKNQYEGNSYALSEGKRLFSQMNCVGCHAHGGGGMGPPLMDDKWLYGSEPEQVFASIMQGRPNGMPSFGGKIPDYQVWELAAYVRSLSGLANKVAATGRDDHLQSGKPENSAQTQQPKNSGTPKSAEMPL